MLGWLIPMPDSPARIAELTCDGLVAPLAVRSEAPRFRWKLDPTRPDLRQGGCQITIRDLTGKVLWTSPRQEGDLNEIAYKGPKLPSGSRFRAELALWDSQGKILGSAESPFGTAADWTPVWVRTPNEPPQPDPYEALPVTMLRTEFGVTKPVRCATLYASALGAYEARLNGKRVGDIVLSPDWTDYHTRVQYQAYDVTSQVKSGSNAIGVLLGDGWYAGHLGMAQALGDAKKPRGVYGRVPSFAAMLRVEYADGTREDFSTSASWQSTQDGPWRSADLLDGVSYDANREMPGWDSAGFKADGWVKAVVTAPNPEPALEPQINEPIRVVDRLKPVSITGNVIDFGQNLPGWARLKIKAKKGETIVVHHAEMLQDDGKVYLANLRGAPQVDTYVSAGGTVWYEPKFTYHGFRYVQVDGGEIVDAEAVVFCTSAPETSTFECSDPMLNRLWQNIRWTARANLMSVPTDCPQRDERLGWMGDILSFGTTSGYFFNLDTFFDKWLQDTRDAQADDGRFPDFAPHPYGKNRHFTGVPGWGDAGVGVARVAMEEYGRTDVAKAQLGAIEKYLAWLEKTNPDYAWKNARHNDYGDWLNGDTIVRDGWPRTGGECPKDVFGTLCWYRSARDAAAMARETDGVAAAAPYLAMADKVAEAFMREYVTPDGKIKGDTQAGYALALWLEIVPESMRSAMFGHLLASLERTQNRLTTGFHSTLPMMEILAKYGRSDLAYHLLTATEFPSWGYTIKNGATTIWERWDGFVAGRGFQDPGMNSFNHWAFGSVGKWMYENIVGIRVDGFRKVRIEPNPGGGLASASGKWESPNGPIHVSWRTTKSGYSFDISIPSGLVVEEISLPGKVVKAEGASLSFGDGRSSARFVGAGRYHFETER